MLFDGALRKTEQRVQSARSNTMPQFGMKEIPHSIGKIEVMTPDFSYLQTTRTWIKRPMRSSKLSRCIVYAGSQSTFTNEIFGGGTAAECYWYQRLGSYN
jgi:hypothetical protein